MIPSKLTVIIFVLIIDIAVWSVGCIFYEMCTGVPFPSSGLHPTLPRDEDFHYHLVAAAFQMCTEKNPASRATTRQLLDLFEVDKAKLEQERKNEGNSLAMKILFPKPSKIYLE